jgi:hypothetical protein
MKSFLEDLKQIYKNERLMLVLMIITLVVSIVLLIFSLVKLSTESIVVKVGYGDIGGYRSGGWAEMLTFPILAFIFGVLHNFIALRIYKKRGAAMAKFFLLATLGLIAGTFIVLVRLSGES